MARRIATADLKPGMTVTSLRTASYVYSFSDDLDNSRRLSMKGKAIVLSEMTRVRLKLTRSRWNKQTQKYEEYPSYCTKNMVQLAHYKHGIVMYFAHNPADAKWRLVEEKKTE